MKNLRAKEFIDHFTAKGEISFTPRQMRQAMNISAKAVERAIARLRQGNEIAAPARGFYLILTPEFRKMGCLPPDYFIDHLMRFWQRNYYVGLLSASLYYGAAHQQLQTFQVVIDRYHRPIHCGDVKIEFITKKAITSTPVKLLKTHTGLMNVSTPEATMMDLVNFMGRSGGISRTATLLDELAESIDLETLVQLLKEKKEVTWVQRLGYLLEYLGHHKIAEVIYEHIKNEKLNVIPLVPYHSITGERRDLKWRVAINSIIESDTHDTD